MSREDLTRYDRSRRPNALPAVVTVGIGIIVVIVFLALIYPLAMHGFHILEQPLQTGSTQGA